MSTLSVIVVNWNTRDLLACCLRSACVAAEGMDAEITVVDNGSTDGSPRMVRESFPEVILLANRENLGFARANNQALRQAHSRYALLLNSDTEVDAGCFRELVAFMDAHPQVGAAGALLLNPDGSLQPSCHPMLTPWREFWRLCFLEHIKHRATYDMAKWPQGKPRRVEAIKGACLLLRKEALDQVGLLDERYFMYTEEVDLCYRLQQAGWELYWVPQAQVLHYEGASSRQIPERMMLQLYQSKIQFYRKFGGEARARLFKALVWVAYLPRLAWAALRGSVSPEWAHRARVYRRLLAALPAM